MEIHIQEEFLPLVMLTVEEMKLQNNLYKFPVTNIVFLIMFNAPWYLF